MSQLYVYVLHHMENIKVKSKYKKSLTQIKLHFKSKTDTHFTSSASACTLFFIS